MMSNSEFAKLVGCHVTTASRYRNGHRLPQVQLLERIRQVVGVTHEEIHQVWSLGPEVFSRFLREHLFDA